MLTSQSPVVLLASHDPALLSAMEPVLTEAGMRVKVALTGDAARVAMAALPAPGLVLLDAELPFMEPEMNLPRMLAALRASDGGERLPIVLISDTVSDEWRSRIEEGVIDELIPCAESAYGRFRLEMVLRGRERMRELERLRESATQHAQTDPLTGVYNRATLLSLLFCETDRVQRMKAPLSLLLFDIDDFGHWNTRLGVEACDDLLRQAVSRAARLLRSYDALGRTGKDEFLVILPGCSLVNAALFAERLRMEVFASPFQVAGTMIRLSACFGLASSEGRSPVVVLREAEQALERAKSSGPESIQCFGNQAGAMADPADFVSPGSGDESPAW